MKTMRRDSVWTAVQAAKEAEMETVFKGSRGETVKLLQNALNGAGFDCGRADGVFGPLTCRALTAYQGSRGLEADGTAGPLTWAKLGEEDKNVSEALSRAPKRPPDFKQYDPRWAKKAYSSCGDKNQTMKSSGCGPTAMADVAAALIDPSVTPPLLADKALSWGDRSRSNGTAWSFFRHVSREYPFGRYLKTGSKNELFKCLDAGGLAVASMGKGYWTQGGHYICVWKHDTEYIYANDPASSKREKQKTDDFMKERKAFFCFWR